MERFRAIQTYDNASDLEAGDVLAAVLSHVVVFQRCSNWRSTVRPGEYRSAPIRIAGEFVHGIGALTTSLWLSWG
jgi:hypothetical protein